MKLLGNCSQNSITLFVKKEQEPLPLQSAQWIDPLLSDYIPEDGSGRRVPIKNAAAYFGEEVHTEVNLKGAFEFGETSLLEHYYLPESYAEDGSINAEKYIDWVEAEIQQSVDGFNFDELNEEGAERLTKIIADAQDYATNHLGVLFPVHVEREIGTLLTAINNRRNLKQSLRLFLEKAQSFKHKSRSTPYVCAFLKILSASLTYHLTPDLHGLEEKTNVFAAELVGSFNSSSVDSLGSMQERLDQGKEVKIAPHIEGSRDFLATNIEFRDKSKFSVFDKILRKASYTAERIVKDGVSARIVLKEDKVGNANFESAHLWLVNLGFTLKDEHTNLTRGEGKNEDRYYRKQLEDGTFSEVQVTTNKGIKKSESGVQDHRVYKMKQRMLIYARLFGSVSAKVLETAIDRVLADVNKNSARVNKEGIEIEIKKLFFALSNNSAARKKPRYTSYDFVARQILTCTLPPRFYSSFYQALTRAGLGKIYLSDAEWETVFDERVFPERIIDDLDQQEEIIKLLKSKKGIPKLIIQELELQLEFAKAETSIQESQYVAELPEELQHSPINLKALREVLNPHGRFIKLPLEVQQDVISYLDWLIESYPQLGRLKIPKLKAETSFKLFDSSDIDFLCSTDYSEADFRPPWYTKP